MGTWNSAPWDDDHAADWFGDLFEATKLAEYVEAALNLDLDRNHRRIRAAASLLIFLGRPYVWPIEDLDRHLALAASKLEAMIALPDADEIMYVEEIRSEAALLRSRMKHTGGASADEKALAKAWANLR